MSPLAEDRAQTLAAPSRCLACGRRIAGRRCPDHGVAVPDREPARGAGPVSVPPPRDLTPPHFAGYRRPRLVGRGGFGAVYAVEPEDGARRVAIKIAWPDRPDAGLRLLEESRVLAEIGPPHVPAVHGCGRLPDGSPYFVMDLIDAPTLADHLVARADAPTPPEEACALAHAALRALEAVHARGYVHRDLKPENIFITGPGEATLVDLGLATRLDRQERLTADEAALGTPEYMAPEQCDGRADMDERADLYAMGVILYELLGGRPPFWGPPAAVREGHRSRRPPRLAALAPIPPALEELVLRCLAKDPRDRFPSAAALRAALEQLDRTPADGAIPPPAPSAPGSGPPNAPSPERRTVGLLFFEADLDVVTVQRHLASLRGELAHAGRGRFVAVFDHEQGGNPVRRALRAAHALADQGVCADAVIDLAPVSIQLRPDGARRIMSPLFSRAERFPAAHRDAGPAGERAHAPGLVLTPAARAALNDAPEPAQPSSPDAETAASADEPTGDRLGEPLFGRADLLEALVEGAAAAAGGAPTVVSVLGEAGYGKSYFGGALTRRLREAHRRAEIIELRAGDPVTGGADRIVRELLQQALGLPASPPRAGGLALIRSRLDPGSADLAPVVALCLGWIAAAESAIDPQLRALAAAPGALRFALTVAAGEALRRRADRAPVFVVLDDAHAAADSTLAALEYAALAEAGARIWICALGRPAFEQAHPAWGERAGRRTAHRLEALDPESAAGLVRHLLLPAENVPEPAIQRLVERAQAIPRLLVELVLGLKREGIVRRHPKGTSWYLATDELDRLPDLPLLEWLAHGEIDALAPTLRAHARLLALLGQELTIAEIAGVLHRLEEQDGAGDFPLDAGIGTERLLAAGLLVPHRRGRVGFRHPLVREALARSTPEPLRRRIHLAAFEFHRAAAAASGDDARLAPLAFHAAQAGLGTVAADAYLTLAERARARHAYVEAETLYSRALEQATAPSGAAHRGRGVVRYRLGRYHDALADFGEALALARAAGDVHAQIELLLDEATALDWMDEYRSSEERVEEALALSAGAAIPPALAAALLLGAGRSLHRFSRQEEAAAMLDRAARAAAPLGDDGYETVVVSLLLLGFLDQGLGRLDESAGALDRAIALCEAHHDKLHLAAATNGRALLHACRGDKDRMIADLTRVLSLARELGQATLELAGEYNLGEYLYLMDDLDAAAPHIGRAVAIERRRAGRPVARLLEARFLYYRGDEGAAREAVAELRAHQEQARGEGGGDVLMVPAEEVLCAAIDLATRRADEGAWEALDARSARYSVGQERVEVLELRAIAALRRGRPAEAQRALEQALAAAARIPNVMSRRLARRRDELSGAEAGRGVRTAPPRWTP